MNSVQACDIPMGSFLREYPHRPGLADCCVTEVAGTVAQAAFVEAFYTSALFKVERHLIQHVLSRPASDADARQLAAGERVAFSAWTVERQSASQRLPADLQGSTRSWLMAAPVPGPAQTTVSTRLYFGSAVVPRARADGQVPRVGWPFHALLGFHRLYSRWLLGAAARRLRSL